MALNDIEDVWNMQVLYAATIVSTITIASMNFINLPAEYWTIT